MNFNRNYQLTSAQALTMPIRRLQPEELAATAAVARSHACWLNQAVAISTGVIPQDIEHTLNAHQDDGPLSL
jgi:hypothetical protein